MEEFKEITVRGRFLYLISCLEKALKEENISYPELDEVIEHFKTYTNTRFIDEWYDKAKEMQPTVMKDDIEDDDFDDYKYLSPDFARRLVYIYENELPQYIVELIDYIVELGSADLYTKNWGWSPYSYQILEFTLKELEKNNFERPSIEPFKKYKIIGDDAYGDPFEYKE